MSQPAATAQYSAAALQATKAVAGLPLQSFADAEDASLFAVGPVDDGGAYRHAGYYTAVAARLLGDRALGVTAGQYVAYATPYVTITPATSALVPTLTTAATAIRTAATASANHSAAGQAGAIAGKLASFATPDALALAQKDDDSLVGMLRRFEAEMESWGKVIAFVGVGVGALAAAAAVWIALKIYETIRGKR